MNLELDTYQRDNLLFLLRKIMDNDQLPVGRYNTGDWVGELRYQLETEDEINPNPVWNPEEHPMEQARALLGQQVVVTLTNGTAEEARIAEGKLLSCEDGGSFTLLDDNGFVHWCWPLLDIRPA